MNTDCCVTWDRDITLSGLQFSQWEMEALTRKFPNVLLETPKNYLSYL